MPLDPLEPEFTSQNPIVAAAERIRARRTLGSALEGSDSSGTVPDDAGEALAVFGASLSEGIKRLNSVLGAGTVKLVRLEKPLRLRVRFGDKRVALEVDEVQQLVRVSGESLDGEYQFDPGASTPSLINLSLISTDPQYGERLTPSSLLKHIAADAELPRPSHLDRSGPMQF